MYRIPFHSSHYTISTNGIQKIGSLLRNAKPYPPTGENFAGDVVTRTLTVEVQSLLEEVGRARRLT
jgi:hypothetical protein